MGKVDLIYQAIKMGVSAPKIIAKYGKQAYDTAKNIKIKDVKKAYSKVKESAKEYKKTGFKKDLELDKKLYAPYESWKLTLGGAGALGLGETAIQIEKKQKKKKLLKKAEQKKQRTESRKAQRGVRSGERGYKGLKSGGSVNSRAIAKKYFKGGLV